MKLFRLKSYEDYLNYLPRITELKKDLINFQNSFLPKSRVSFTVPGYSYTAGKIVDFYIDYQHASPNGPVIWRERVICPETHFNNRMRATIHLFDLEMNPYPDLKIYLTEQITPLYKYFSANFIDVYGSEYLGSDVPLGALNYENIRNEDLSQLTFPDDSFDALVCLDVLEHIPEYKKAFSESFRVLRKGGRLMWSAPFVCSSKSNIVRARIVEGNIIHDMAPEYHGDPLSDSGVLCFQYFGWEVMEQLLSIGFSEVYAICYFSKEFGYLGGEQFMFFATK